MTTEKGGKVSSQENGREEHTVLVSGCSVVMVPDLA